MRCATPEAHDDVERRRDRIIALHKLWRADVRVRAEVGRHVWIGPSRERCPSPSIVRPFDPISPSASLLACAASWRPLPVLDPASGLCARSEHDFGRCARVVSGIVVSELDPQELGDAREPEPIASEALGLGGAHHGDAVEPPRSDCAVSGTLNRGVDRGPITHRMAHRWDPFEAAPDITGDLPEARFALD